MKILGLKNTHKSVDVIQCNKCKYYLEYTYEDIFISNNNIEFTYIHCVKCPICNQEISIPSNTSVYDEYKDYIKNMHNEFIKHYIQYIIRNFNLDKNTYIDIKFIMIRNISKLDNNEDHILPIHYLPEQKLYYLNLSFISKFQHQLDNFLNKIEKYIVLHRVNNINELDNITI